jgi:putative phage-type endonuclease
MIIHADIDQRSEAWHLLRCGRITGTGFVNVMAKGKGNAPSKTRTDYMYQLASERLGDARSNFKVTGAMQDGIDFEDEAREAYEFTRLAPVQEVGFVEMDENIGVSPDGLIGNDGVLEIKIPLGKTHLKYVAEDRLPPEYKKQVQGQLWVCERQYCDFVSYNPFMTHHKLHVVRVERDEKFIDELKYECSRFLQELNKMIEGIKHGK